LVNIFGRLVEFLRPEV